MDNFEAGLRIVTKKIHHRFAAQHNARDISFGNRTGAARFVIEQGNFADDIVWLHQVEDRLSTIERDDTDSTIPSSSSKTQAPSSPRRKMVVPFSKVLFRPRLISARRSFSVSAENIGLDVYRSLSGEPGSVETAAILESALFIPVDCCRLLSIVGLWHKSAFITWRYHVLRDREMCSAPDLKCVWRP